ncbi:MAG: GLPGLI family protein [Bacteroidota bacterium]|nr:GLPGLI family protein [Bacteroidota bacterium]
MKCKISCIIIALFIITTSYAQQFISKASIEYEVVSNIQKTMSNMFWMQDLKDKLPTFKTGYYTFTFADDKSIYKFDHWDEQSRKIPDFLKKGDEENVWYSDYNSGKLNMQKNIWGSNVNVEDSIRKLNWKITNESRIIAGFNCRKAVSVMFDSVYVFAFYTDEILIPGGPCSINGLPGMILGVTIPRLYTSWIATKIMVTNVDESVIKPLHAKKNLTLTDLKSTIIDHTKEWYDDDETLNKEIQQQKVRTLWGTLL